MSETFQACTLVVKVSEHAQEAPAIAPFSSYRRVAWYWWFL